MYRSSALVSPRDHRADRSALTTIYFLLTADDVSRWHRVMSDEVWHYYEGDPLQVWVADRSFDGVETITLGPVASARAPVHVVAAGRWQAARTTGVYTLVGCTVAPGFEFADFTLIDDSPEALAAATRSRHALAISPFLRRRT